MSNTHYDLVVIGGGINGAGIAADAAGRGLKVLLAEAEDLAGATSSASSKLIHGGLRYLEHYAFRLVREALAEREVLLAKAPHIVWPLRFVLPQVPGMRPAPVLRAGLFLYDHLSARRTLGGSRNLDLRRDAAGKPLAEGLNRGFAYWDCWVDDARLVVLNALAAREKGADILTRTPVTSLTCECGAWRVLLATKNGARAVFARTVVNASGPWVEAVAGMAPAGNGRSRPHVRLVKGSHIVVQRIAGADDAYIFQNDDGRVVFALPFEGAFTLIGTTDTPISGDPRRVEVSVDDQSYLLAVANRFFRSKLGAADIVWQFAGVRPLDDDGSDSPSAVSRDYRLELETGSGAPILHVIGGKITTYRRLAEAALDHLKPHFANMGPAWTAGAALPGGDVGPDGFDTWFDAFTEKHPGFAAEDLKRLARRYGTRTENLKHEELAQSADDVLWRRTKTGLHVPPDRRADVASHVQAVLDGV
jgi:glycerol-3-phosphate dehydrogenase